MTTPTTSFNESSAENEQHASEEMVIYIAAEILIALIALFNNSFVILAVCKFKHLRTRTYILLACLAFADIGVALFAIPSAILLRIGLERSDGSPDSAQIGAAGRASVGREFCFVIISSVIFLTQVSIFNLLIIAIDRFVAIYYSLRYRAIITRFRVKLGIAGAWIFGALIGFLPQLGWNDAKHETADTSPIQYCAFEDVINMEYMVYFNFFVCVLLPLAIMFILYILIFRSAKKQLRKIYSDVRSSRWKFSKASLASLRDAIQPISIRGAITPILDRVCRHSKASKCGVRKFKKNRRNDTETSILDSGVATGDPIALDLLEFAGPATPTKVVYSRANADRMLLRSSSTPKITSAGEALDLQVLRVERSLSQPEHLYKESETPERNSPIEYAWRGYVTHTPFASGLNSNASTLPRDPDFGFDSRRSSCYSTSVAAAGRLNSDASSVAALSRNCDENPEAHQGRKFKRKSKLLRREFRAARSLCTVVGVFALCWLPLHVINCVTLFCGTCVTPAWLKDFAILLSHANSLVNPIIYAFHLRDMKRAFQQIVKQAWRGAGCPPRKNT